MRHGHPTSSWWPAGVGLLLGFASLVMLVISVVADLAFDYSECPIVDGRRQSPDICGGNLVYVLSSRTMWLLALLAAAVALLLLAALVSLFRARTGQPRQHEESWSAAQQVMP